MCTECTHHGSQLGEPATCRGAAQNPFPCCVPHTYQCFAFGQREPLVVLPHLSPLLPCFGIQMDACTMDFFITSLAQHWICEILPCRFVSGLGVYTCVFTLRIAVCSGVAVPLSVLTSTHEVRLLPILVDTGHCSLS